MSDLVKRLREGVGNGTEHECMDAEEAMDSAADEIERLRVQLDQCQSALVTAIQERDAMTMAYEAGAQDRRGPVVKLIIRDVKPDDWSVAIRAGQWLNAQPDTQRDAILSYGPFGDYYVKRNKSSITVRPCASHTATERSGEGQ